jgi:uncharacterized protein (DUF1330 family)
MLARLDPARIRALYLRDLPGPVDVLNLIQLRSAASYRVYGAMVAPSLLLFGHGLPWMGHHRTAFAGPTFADKLLVVRYPSHRHFMRMTLNPYYALCNVFRTRAVARFEASFTHSQEHRRDFSAERHLLIAHFASPCTGDALAGLIRLVEKAGGRFVYASREVAPIDFFKRNIPSDPNPLTHPEHAFFAFASASALDRAVTPELIDALSLATERLALHAFERDPLSAYLPRWSRARA